MSYRDKIAQIKKAYLDQLKLWRPYISPPTYQKLRLEQNVRSIIDELIESPRWETVRGEHVVVLTERFVSQKSSTPYVILFHPLSVML